jgi:asparagine synthase (glutamine-hydrolysing)
MLEEIHADADYFQRMASFDLRFRLPEQLLARIDRMSMAASVEARVPFLDHRLVEAAIRLPLGAQGELIEQKVLLKKIASRYLPEKIIHRPKDGFSVPLSEVMYSNPRDWDDAINTINAHCVMRKGQSLATLMPRELWSVFSLSLWISKQDGYR